MSTVERPAVHQVLATLGYGDAIGHEVLGIQRVLRASGYESDIFVETADPRLEPLTRELRVENRLLQAPLLDRDRGVVAHGREEVEIEVVNGSGMLCRMASNE